MKIAACEKNFRLLFVALLICSTTERQLCAQALNAPPGMFKDVDDETIGQALLIRGKQLFIDDYIIQELHGLEKTLNQPVKHSDNPLLVKDRVWEQSGPGYGTVIYDADSGIFKMWYGVWIKDAKPSEQLLCYATSKDGIHWEKPTVSKDSDSNIVDTPKIKGFHAAGIFIDPVEHDQTKRYKMLFDAAPDGTAKTWSINAAYSPDGLHWTAEPQNPLIPFGDTQVCPFWDIRLGRYVAYLRFGPPNTRLVSRSESEDFVHWSPKVTIVRPTKIDQPLNTQFYQMAPMPYEGVYLGLIAAYHNETLKPIPENEPWTDRKNLYLAFSRNGLTWSRVGAHGVIEQRELDEDRDWQKMAMDAVFVPYGNRQRRDWDRGTVSPYYMPKPLVVGNELWLYYMATNDRNWWNYAGDPPILQPNAPEPQQGVGLAKLRLDGFVSVDAGNEEGTLTTKPLVFIGDAIEINANAKDGEIRVEALDIEGNVIEGFGRELCCPISTDSVHHLLKWKSNDDMHLLQSQPIRLKYYVRNAKLFSFTPRILHKHYIPSYE